MSLQPFEETLSSLVQQKKQNHLFREIFKYENFDSNVVEFASNDYLDLRRNKNVLEAGIQAAKKSGSGSGASRIVMQTDTLIDALEAFLCSHINFKHSVFFPSGFVSNVSFFDALSTINDIEFFIDHRAHASLFFGLRASKCPFQIFKHDDFLNLSQKLNASDKKTKIIIVESIHSMDGTQLDPYALKNICETHHAHLFIDESHTFGIIGKHGAGYVSLFPFLEEHTFAISLGCGKAVGVSGGFIATNSLHFKELLIQDSKHMMFSTGISPFITGAVLKSLEIIFGAEGEMRRKALFSNLTFFNTYAKNHNQNVTSSTPIIPFIIGDNQKALKISNALIKAGMIVKCMRPPTVPRNTSRLRISLKSSHTHTQIQTLLKFIETQDV